MYTIGLDLGGTFIKGGLVDDGGKIVAKSKIPTRIQAGPEAVAADMAAQALALIADAGVKKEDVRGIGIGSPGAIDSENGIVNYANNLTGWIDVPLAAYINAKTGLGVKVSNDANVAALGETMFGAGKGYENAVMITLGTGVGGGVICNGRLYEGNESKGAELGHMVVKAGGARCNCGRRGCLEAYASATALIRETKKAMKKHPESAMWKFSPDIDEVDGRTSFECAKAGDAAAAKVVDDYLYYLAEGLLNYCNIFRPQVIILGGGVCAQGDYLIGRLDDIMSRAHYGYRGAPAVKLVIATLGNDAGLIGAASLIMGSAGAL